MALKRYALSCEIVPVSAYTLLHIRGAIAGRPGKACERQHTWWAFPVAVVAQARLVCRGLADGCVHNFAPLSLYRFFFSLLLFFVLPLLFRVHQILLFCLPWTIATVAIETRIRSATSAKRILVFGEETSHQKWTDSTVSSGYNAEYWRMHVRKSCQF